MTSNDQEMNHLRTAGEIRNNRFQTSIIIFVLIGLNIAWITADQSKEQLIN